MRVKASKPSVRNTAARLDRDGKPAPRVRKRLWIFDFDNTIARLEPEVDWAASRLELEPMLRGAGVPEELFERFVRRNLPLYDATRSWLLAESRSIRAGAKRAEARRRMLSTLRRASSIIEKHELAGVDRAKPLEGAVELIRGLGRGGSQIAFVTSNSSRTIRRWLGLHSLVRSVGTIVGRDSLLGLKPSPEMVRLALRKCGARAAHAAFVGDTAGDFHAASTAGVDFYGIASKPGSRDILLAAGAREIFSSPAALAVHLDLPGAPQAAPTKNLVDAGEDGRSGE